MEEYEKITHLIGIGGLLLYMSACPEQTQFIWERVTQLH